VNQQTMTTALAQPFRAAGRITFSYEINGFKFHRLQNFVRFFSGPLCSIMQCRLIKRDARQLSLNEQLLRETQRSMLTVCKYSVSKSE